MRTFIGLIWLYLMVLIWTFMDTPQVGAAPPTASPVDTMRTSTYSAWDASADSSVFHFQWRKTDPDWDPTVLFAAGCDSFDGWVKASFGKGPGQEEMISFDSIAFAVRQPCLYDTVQHVDMDSLFALTALFSGKRPWVGVWVYLRAVSCGYTDSTYTVLRSEDTAYVYDDLFRRISFSGVVQTLK